MVFDFLVVEAVSEGLRPEDEAVNLEEEGSQAITSVAGNRMPGTAQSPAEMSKGDRNAKN
jgi:hypothetical protein